MAATTSRLSVSLSTWRYRCLLLGLSFISPGTFAQDDDWDDDTWSAAAETKLQWSGFVEAAAGSRWREDKAVGRHGTLADVRARLETSWQADKYLLSLKADGVLDGISQEVDGEFRELAIAGSPFKGVDVKAGRQVLTWGTGDLLFLNDFFPKDWVSFFAGREDEYLKAASTSIRVTHYSSLVNTDFVWTPGFTSDNFITGQRFSFYSPIAAALVSPEPPLGAKRPARNFRNGEFSMRLFRTWRSGEYAFYAHRGFFKAPSDFSNPSQPRFAPLTSVGASLRRPAWAGIWNLEIAYYASRNDRRGDNADLPNDQVRLLSGFEREWLSKFTVGLQYYLEWTQDYKRLIAGSARPELEVDEYRHLFTTRFTYRSHQDKLIWSLFAFVSPSDHDFYLRPVLNFRYDDNWRFSAGLNLFGGRNIHSFFGQFDDASNAYLRVRYNF